MKETADKILGTGRRVLEDEARAMQRLAAELDDSFVEAVRLILSMDGRLIISGIGKSANVAQKIVATMNSTGTPAVFMHAADAIHGDLGILQPGKDLVMILSKSGQTSEVTRLARLVKEMAFPLIAMTANAKSELARLADVVLRLPVEKEACPYNLAPTTSTTLQMALGDALAIAILEQRHFTPADFARFHPGGSLGKRLHLKVGELLRGKEIPRVDPDTPIKDVIMEITAKRVGGTAVMENGRLAGIITDGDIRRMLQNHNDISSVKARDIMSARPKTTTTATLAYDALQTMKKHNINQLIVLDENGQYAGIVHLHEILKEGIL